jgi:hypothetical protein
MKQCVQNERFAETWLFLDEILEEPAEKLKLQAIFNGDRPYDAD